MANARANARTRGKDEYDRQWRNYYTKNRDAYAANPSARRDADLRQKYGISLEEFNRRFLEQEERCAICDRSDLQLVPDHDHLTGGVRALLCNGCNLGLGHFRDDISVISSALEYLREHS